MLAATLSGTWTVNVNLGQGDRTITLNFAAGRRSSDADRSPARSELVRSRMLQLTGGEVRFTVASER